MNSYVVAALVSAKNPIGPETVKPGWVALLVVLALCVATYFLARSFLRHSRKAQQPWEGEDPKHPQR